jgi:hypothetical protein
VQLSRTVGDWSAPITEIAEGYMNGSVDWFTAGTHTAYDPATGEGGETAETEIGTTPARIQHLREPREVSSAYQATDYRRIRVQIPFSDMGLAIVKGVRGRITDGGKDPNLTGLVLVVQDARNSSWAALRTVECLVESSGPPPEPEEEEEP